jgi:hypothetical protein
MHALPQIRDAQAAYGFVTAQGRNIETAIYKRRYPNFDYAPHVPVVTEGNPWSIGTQFRISDWAGQAKFVSGKAHDIPFVKTTRELQSHDFLMIAAGWEWSIEEVEQAQLYGISVRNDDAMAGDAAVQMKLYDIAMVGDSEVGWTGLVNDPNVPSAAGGYGVWSGNSVDEILTDINTGLATVRTQTGETEFADTVRLPPEAFRFIATKRLGTDGSMGTVLQYVRANNVYTAETGNPLDIAPLRSLADVPDGGDGGRAIYYRKDPEVLRFHLPLPRMVLQVNQVGLMAFEQGVISRTGGTEIRLPKAMFYQDGITASGS